MINLFPLVTMQRYYIIIDYVCFPYCTCHPHNSPEHVSLGESKLLPTSLGGSLRTEGGFDSGSFQMTASALGPGVCEALWVPFKSGVSVCHSPLALLKISTAGLQRQVFRGLIFLEQNPQAGKPDVGLRAPCFLGRASVCGLPPAPGHGPWLFRGSSSPTVLRFHLPIFSCRRSFVVGSGLFHWEMFCQQL